MTTQRIRVRAQGHLVAEFSRADGFPFSEVVKKYQTGPDGQLLPRLGFAPVTLQEGVVWDEGFYEWCQETPIVYQCGCESWRDRIAVTLTLVEEDEVIAEAYLYDAIPVKSDPLPRQGGSNSYPLPSVTFEFSSMEALR